jgi:hypothetical protein
MNVTVFLERRLVTMIEIIREESCRSEGTKELPKDIRQMGTPDIGTRIYVERRVYEKIHEARREHDKMVYVLLGRCENYAGKSCTFAEAAIAMERMVFVNNVPRWSDDTWAYLYRHLTRAHENMVIIGWAIDIRGMMPRLTAQLEKMHMDHFGGAHQVMLLMDTLEGEEYFYGVKNGRLCRREGFYIYNEVVKTININKYNRNGERNIKNAEYNENKDAGAGKNGNFYRRINKVRRLAGQAAVIALVAALGRTAYLNRQKMNELEAALMEVSGHDVENEKIVVETVSGNVAAVEEPAEGSADGTNIGEQSEEAASAEVGAMGSDGEAESLDYEAWSEAGTYIAQGYYIVQEGDSLAEICRKIYQTTAVMDSICELNGIENENSIYVGQRLALPN